MESLAKIDIRHLRYFVAMARVGAVTRAAYALRVSPPSFGRQIRDLESRLGVPLFDRSDRRCELSACGKFYLEQAEQLIDEWDTMFRSLQSRWLRTNPRPIIAVPEYMAASDWLSGKLYPRLQGRLREAALPTVCEYDREPGCSEILERNVDFVLALAAPADRDMSVAKIDEGPVVAILPADHPLSEHEEVDLADLDGELLRVSMDSTRFPRLANLDAALGWEDSQFSPKPMKVSRIKTALELIGSGRAYGISHGLGYSSMLDSKVTVRPIRNCKPQPLFLVWRKGDNDELSTAIVEALHSADSLTLKTPSPTPTVCLQSS